MCSKIASFAAFLAVLVCGTVAHKAWDYHVLTWNMQGANGMSSKWDALSNVLRQARPLISVVALQECGELPRTSAIQAHRLDTVTQIGTVSGDQVSLSSWDSPEGSRGGSKYYIYHATSYPSNAATRTNYAILSRELAQEVILIDTRFEPRPVLCIRLNDYGRDEDRYYCSLHANAKQTNLGHRTVQALEDQFNQRKQQTGRDFSWMILADYNRSPTIMAQLFLDIPVPPGFQRRIVNSGQTTQKSGDELDYAVVGSTSAHPNIDSSAQQDNNLHFDKLISDHNAVHFYPANRNVAVANAPKGL